MLAHNGLAFQTRDIFREPLSAEELRALAAHASLTELFSWRSPTARARGLQPGGLGDTQMLELMQAEPRLVRRPLVLAGNRLVIGADVEAIKNLA